jgi:glycosyltransferase involved in cell wall biosynthesis
MKTGHVRAFYPADPAGVVPGGVDTFLRGILKYAPDDLRFSLVGMTTDETARPCGRWTRCQLGQREFDFFPVVRVADAGQRSRIPLSVRYTAALLRYGSPLRRGFDVMEFHRVEPALLFLNDARPKNAFFHQDMAVIRSDKADILWRHFPGLYFSIERRVVKNLSSAWCVRQEGAAALRSRFPEKADVIRFVPTWVDTEVFTLLGLDRRLALREKFADTFGLDTHASWVISVGRLDNQKNPELLLNAVAKLRAEGHNVQWLIVGDGMLRPLLTRLGTEAGLSASMKFLGLLPPARIAELLSASDVFALSSAYEGMPMALLEALGTGLPVACTDVGEVRLVVQPGINGAIAAAQDLASFSECLKDVVTNSQRLRGASAVQAIQPYQPATVLAPVYENYRLLAKQTRPSN